MPDTDKKTTDAKAAPKEAAVSLPAGNGFGAGGGFGGAMSYKPTAEEIAEWDRIAKERAEADGNVP